MAVCVNQQLPTILTARLMRLLRVRRVVVKRFIVVASVTVNGNELSFKRNKIFLLSF